MMKNLVVWSTAALAGAGSALALASEPSFDVSEAISTLSGVETAIMAVGAVMIGLAAIAVGFKWVKAGIFG